ncbi:hypothetical protein [Paenibacillus sp. SYP-B4298]|uniref:hypothetical protein n=1 Tax=Paenibacillus sp. SYP-B4298 TaxID=2996034 RepID=UPI0022DE02C7|nr:hypothetical protein [Paenibacillus sp. SYP-B4298]
MRNYIWLTCIRVWSGKVFLGITLLSILAVFFLIRLTHLPSHSNHWDSFFFVFSNPYVYFLLFLTSFLVIVQDIYQEGALGVFIAARLTSKQHWLFARYIVVFLTAILIVFIVFGAASTISIAVHGGDYSSEWSKVSSDLELSYTSFAATLSPVQGMVLWFVRYFAGLLGVGLVYSTCCTLWKGRLFPFLMTATFLFTQSLVNMSAIPGIGLIDISARYIYSYEISDGGWGLFLLKSHIPLLLFYTFLVLVNIYRLDEVEIE